jgi:hypothetical protein
VTSATTLKAQDALSAIAPLVHDAWGRISVSEPLRPQEADCDEHFSSRQRFVELIDTQA